MRIYIIGPSGAGKTTLANKLAKKYNIEAYELDCIVHDDDNNHIKRSDQEIDNLFNQIINKKNWIIEDVGRSRFENGLKLCDKIYYLKISKFIVYFRVIRRWIKQRLGREKYNYPPTLFQFCDMLKTAREYFKKEKQKLESINKYNSKVIYLNYRDLNSI